MNAIERAGHDLYTNLVQNEITTFINYQPYSVQTLFLTSFMVRVVS